MIRETPTSNMVCEESTLCLCHKGLVGTKMGSAHHPSHMPPRGQLPMQHLCGLPPRHSAPTLHSEDALLADTNQPALSTPQDRCQINPHSRDAKLKIKLKKKKNQPNTKKTPKQHHHHKKQPREKHAAFCQTSNFQLDRQKHFRLLKPREERKQSPSSSTSIESTQMKCKFPV